MHYKQIDGLRFIAVMAVLFHHICPFPIWRYFPPGLFGVNLFFVISGFLITEILVRERLSGASPGSILKAFFLRRIVRIFPLYYLYLFICYLIIPEITRDFIDWLAIYAVNIWIAINNSLTFWYFTHLWSLCVEEQFYILWPFLIIFFPVKRLSLLFITMVLVAMTLRGLNTFYMVGYHLFNYTMLPTAIDCFGAGALLAYLKIFKPDSLHALLRHKYLISAAILFSILNNAFENQYTQEAFGRALHALMGFYLVGIAATIQFGGKFKAFLENKLVAYIGKISYGVYVYHILMWGSVGEYFAQFWEYLNIPGFPKDSNARHFCGFLFISLCTVIVSALSFELFEKRFLWLKKFFKYQPDESGIAS